VERNAAYFTAVISPALASLPTAVIHSDANDYNVIVAPESLEIAGVIDFGDLMLTARVCELGNCIGYAILDKDDIVEVAAQIAAGSCFCCP
jgi:Ser/Thr protein kinase RdoA (MazF antagonist)